MGNSGFKALEAGLASLIKNGYNLIFSLSLTGTDKWFQFHIRKMDENEKTAIWEGYCGNKPDSVMTEAKFKNLFRDIIKIQKHAAEQVYKGGMAAITSDPNFKKLSFFEKSGFAAGSSPNEIDTFCRRT